MLFGGETAQSYYEEGLTAAMKGDLPLALARFRRALELDVQLHNARYQIGTSVETRRCPCNPWTGALRRGKRTMGNRHEPRAACAAVRLRPF